MNKKLLSLALAGCMVFGTVQVAHASFLGSVLGNVIFGAISNASKGRNSSVRQIKFDGKENIGKVKQKANGKSNPAWYYYRANTNSQLTFDFAQTAGNGNINYMIYSDTKDILLDESVSLDEGVSKTVALKQGEYYLKVDYSTADEKGEGAYSFKANQKLFKTNVLANVADIDSAIALPKDILLTNVISAYTKVDKPEHFYMLEIEDILEAKITCNRLTDNGTTKFDIVQKGEIEQDKEGKTIKHTVLIQNLKIGENDIKLNPGTYYVRVSEAVRDGEVYTLQLNM